MGLAYSAQLRAFKFFFTFFSTTHLLLRLLVLISMTTSHSSTTVPSGDGRPIVEVTPSRLQGSLSAQSMGGSVATILAPEQAGASSL